MEGWSVTQSKNVPGLGILLIYIYQAIVQSSQHVQYFN